MKINKTYRLLKFLNRPHSFPLRLICSIISWPCALIITRSIILANHLAQEFFRDDFYKACRRAGWYATQFSAKLNLFSDLYFDFTEGIGAQERKELDSFLKRKLIDKPLSLGLSDFLYLEASNLHEQLESSGDSKVDLNQDITHFYDTCDRLLSFLPKKSEEVPSQNAPREIDFSKKDATEALRDFSLLFPLSEWPWFIISGTALGLHRDGSFLDHDYDIDLGIMSEHVNIHEVAQKLKNTSTFAVKKVDHHIKVISEDNHYFSLVRQPALIKLTHHSGLSLDLFIHHQEGEVCWHGSSIHRWENSLFNLEEGELEGITVNKPSNLDQYLEENYGQWRQVVKDFNCTTGTPNLTISKNFLSIALFLKKLAILLKKGNKQAERLEETLTHRGLIYLCPQTQQPKINRSFLKLKQ